MRDADEHLSRARSPTRRESRARRTRAGVDRPRPRRPAPDTACRVIGYTAERGADIRIGAGEDRDALRHRDRRRRTGRRDPGGPHRRGAVRGAPEGGRRAARADPGVHATTPTEPDNPEPCAPSPSPSAGTGWRAGTSWPAPSRRAVDSRLAAPLRRLHATDPATPYLSLWARVPGFRRRRPRHRALRRRSLVKHLAMRRTLWVVRAADLPAAASRRASDRVADNERRRLIADVEKAGRRRRRRRVAGHGVRRRCCGTWPSTATPQRRELRAALPELAGTLRPSAGKALGRSDSAGTAGADGAGRARRHRPRPQRGRLDDVAARWVQHRHWLGSDAERDGARSGPRRIGADLAARPSGRRRSTDIKWWFGNTLTWARQALRAIDAVEVDLDGTPGFALPDDLDDEPAPRAVVRAAARSRRHHHGLVRTATGISAGTGPGVRHQRQRRARRRGGTGGSSAAGTRTPTAGSQLHCSKTSAGRAEKRWRARRTS